MFFSILILADVFATAAGIILYFILKKQNTPDRNSSDIKLNDFQTTLHGTPGSPQVGMRLASSSYEATGPGVNEYENEENSFLAKAETLYAIRETEIFA